MGVCVGGVSPLTVFLMKHSCTSWMEHMVIQIIIAYISIAEVQIKGMCDSDDCMGPVLVISFEICFLFFIS